MPPVIPKHFKFGGLSFRIFVLRDGRYAFSYLDGTRWRVAKRRSIEKLRLDAERISTALLNAETAALDMTAEERRIYIAARTALAPTGRHLDTLAREIADVHAIIGGVSIAELARCWQTHGAAGAGICPPAVEVIARLVAKLRDDRRDPGYISTLSRDLLRFAAAVPDLTKANEESLRAYLRGLVTRNGAAVSDRRRDNIRDAIVLLFRFARDRSWLAEDRKTVAEKIGRLNPGVTVTTYTPTQLAHLLEHIGPRWLPWMALGAFAGMRTSEIFRLEWDAFKWDERVIAVRRSVARKVKVSRLVPISETLHAWLAPYREHTGPLYANQQTHKSGPTWHTLENQHSKEIERLGEVSGINYEKNALRHSYGSHRLAIVKNPPQVAMEMGTSSKMIRAHYEDPKPEAVALKYFALRPPSEADNVVPLALEFH